MSLLSGASEDQIRKQVDEQIRMAIAEGMFDNLEGSGKPLPESRFVSMEDRTAEIATRILAKNDFKPQWIEQRQKIIQEKENIRDEMRELFASALEEYKDPHLTRYHVYDKINHSQGPQVKKINKMIVDYNLIAPSMHQQIFCMNIKAELDLIKKSFENSNDE
jgi:hypothetical protein